MQIFQKNSSFRNFFEYFEYFRIMQFSNVWFSSENSSHPSNMRKYMQEIDKKLLQIRPSKFVPSTPRSIYSHNLWGAHEYFSFFLYYALAVFKDVMSLEYYQHLKKFVLFLETILSPKINVANLKRVEIVLIEFVNELSELYSKSIMLSGAYELLHLTQCTLEFGPLDSINCFQYEELNRKLMRFLHGTDLIGKEIIKICGTSQIISLNPNQL